MSCKNIKDITVPKATNATFATSTGMITMVTSLAGTTTDLNNITGFQPGVSIKVAFENVYLLNGPLNANTVVTGVGEYMMTDTKLIQTLYLSQTPTFKYHREFTYGSGFTKWYRTPASTQLTI